MDDFINETQQKPIYIEHYHTDYAHGSCFVVLCCGLVLAKLPLANSCNGPLARYVKFRVAHATGIPGTFPPPPLVSDPEMHHGTCVTHAPWCMSGSLTSGGGGNVPGIPGACATRNFTYHARGALHELAKGYLANTKLQQNTTKHEPCA